MTFTTRLCPRYDAPRKHQLPSTNHQGDSRRRLTVQQATIHPIIEKTVAKGSSVYTDEYRIYAKLPGLGYGHKTVCHGQGEYARDEDGDGFCEVHVNTLEGFWSLLRSWLRPHRGISQEKLPLYLGFFQFVHNARRRGKALLGSLIEALVTEPAPITPEPDKSHLVYSMRCWYGARLTGIAHPSTCNAPTLFAAFHQESLRFGWNAKGPSVFGCWIDDDDVSNHGITEADRNAG